jgi:hypothetical protein
MMIKDCFLVAALVSSTCAYAGSGSTSIGTVNARGDVRVDGYTLQSNGTIFDGTAVETQQFPATVRLNNGTEIKLATNSRGVVYHDHLVLLQGESQLKASSAPYSLDAKGLHVAPSGSANVGLVSLNTDHAVDIAAVSGEFRVTDGNGAAIGRLSTGEAMARFDDTPPPSGNWSTIETEGIVSAENGHFYITVADGTIYQVEGADLTKFVGTKVIVSGRLIYPTNHKDRSIIVIQSIQGNGFGSGMFATTADTLWFTTIIAAAAALGGYAGYISSRPPASR